MDWDNKNFFFCNLKCFVFVNILFLPLSLMFVNVDDHYCFVFLPSFVFCVLPYLMFVLSGPEMKMKKMMMIIIKKKFEKNEKFSWNNEKKNSFFFYFINQKLFCSSFFLLTKKKINPVTSIWTDKNQTKVNKFQKKSEMDLNCQWK